MIIAALYPLLNCTVQVHTKIAGHLNKHRAGFLVIHVVQVACVLFF